MTPFCELAEISDKTTKSRAIDISWLKSTGRHHFATLFSLVTYRGKIKYLWQLRNGRVISGNCVIDYLPTELFLFIKTWNGSAQGKQCRCNQKPQGNPTSDCTPFPAACASCSLGDTPMSVWTESMTHVKKLPFCSFQKVRLETWSN